MIIKLQKSLDSSDDKKMVLAYNKDRSILYQQPLDDDLEELFTMVDEPKVYVEAEIDKDNKMEIIDIVEEQNW